MRTTVLIALLCFAWTSSCKGLRGRSEARGPEGALPPKETATQQGGPAPLADLTSIVAGDDRTCAVKKDGALMCWGKNYGGQLGFVSQTMCRNDECVLIPAAVPFLSQVVQVALAVGSDANVEQSCARGRSGAAICWASTPDPRSEAPGAITRVPHRAELADVIDVAVGGEHLCAVKKSGHVLCWGWNGSGQLGFTSTTICKIPTGHGSYDMPCEPKPRQIPDLDGVAALAIGKLHSCARMTNATVQCWGQNGYGELGDGKAGFRPEPKPVVGLTDVEEVRAGADHTCARKKDGSVWCWGEGGGGRLGTKGESCTTPSLPGWRKPCLRTPRAVPDITAVELRAGKAHTCVRRADGAVLCWGDNSDGPFGGAIPRAPDVPPTVVGTFADAAEISTGDRHTCVRRSNGTASCWGGNAYGQLGDGTQIARARPADVLTAARRPGRLSDVAEIKASANQTCARTTAGAVFCWGTNSTLGPAVNVATPVTPLEKTDQLAVGNNHACAHHPGGSVSCWGDSSGGKLGLPRKPQEGGLEIATVTMEYMRNRHKAEPVRAAAVPGGVTAVAANGDQTCARSGAGKVVCWGRNLAQDVGFLPRDTFDPLEIPGVADVAQVAVGESHVCALKNDGTVVCWGLNHFGQLGLPHSDKPGRPTTVAGVANATAIAVGREHTCALRKDGEVLCWGKNYYGELGYPTTTKCWSGDPCNATPAPVRDLPDVVEVAAGSGFTCARTKKGAVYCWGSNSEGCLGDGTKERRTNPERVEHLSDAAELTAGYSHACARKKDGTAWCWGSNVLGQLGDGSTNNRFYPWPVLR